MSQPIASPYPNVLHSRCKTHKRHRLIVIGSVYDCFTTCFTACLYCMSRCADAEVIPHIIHQVYFATADASSESMTGIFPAHWSASCQVRKPDGFFTILLQVCRGAAEDNQPSSRAHCCSSCVHCLCHVCCKEDMQTSCSVDL
jgi:hypothetical protein